MQQQDIWSLQRMWEYDWVLAAKVDGGLERHSYQHLL